MKTAKVMLFAIEEELKKTYDSQLTHMPVLVLFWKPLKLDSFSSHKASFASFCLSKDHFKLKSIWCYSYSWIVLLY